MPKGSEELINARKEEIINACAALYETMSFKEITIRDISEKTSFSRPSIYNYFQTKEEIFLALLEREHEEWIAALRELAESSPSLSVEEPPCYIRGETHSGLHTGCREYLPWAKARKYHISANDNTGMHLQDDH